ncbi:MAG: SlyX family protein [Rhodocyclaceae bacterium]|nr:SlyX family protein [Rhodocyclaceae bacterium]
MDERIIELEIKLGFTEDMIDALNGTIYRQQQQIDALQQAFQALRQQMLAAQPAEQRSLRDEIPPHY